MANYYHGAAYATVDVADVQEGLLWYAWASRGKLKKYLEQDVCPALERYMKQNRPWQDRTTTAREGLKADVQESGNQKSDDYQIGVRVYHTAYHNGFPYGMSLEYGSYNVRTGRKNRPYPILRPTVEKKGQEVVEGMYGLLEDVGFYG